MARAASIFMGLRKLRAVLSAERGSATTEFVFVSALLLVLTMGLMQFALAMYARNVAIDAAIDGAFHAALADRSLADGAQRAEDAFSQALPGLSADVSASEFNAGFGTAVRIELRTAMPVLGLWGPEVLVVRADAPQQVFGD